MASFCLGLSGLVAFIRVIYVFKVDPGIPDFLNRLVIHIMGITPVAVIAGIVFGRQARVDIQGGENRGERLARAGLVLSYTAAIMILVTIVWFVAWLINGLAGI